MKKLPPRKAKLLFLESLPTVSGGQSVLLQLAPELQNDFDLAVLLPGEGPLAEALHQLGVSCYMAPIGSYSLAHKTLWDALNYTLRLPWLTLSTWRLIRQQQVSLIYANSARTFTWGTCAAMLAGRPILWHHHSLLSEGKVLSLLRVLARLTIVRRIICASEAARQQFQALGQKAIAIPNGVDIQRFRPSPELGAAIREELAIPMNNPAVGIVGDLISLKGQHVFLEAARLGSPEVRYLVIGNARPGDSESGDYAARLHRMASSNALFTGYRGDLPALLNALDVLVVASERETGPLVMLEALACGVPVVSTPVGRAPEVLRPEALFPIGDAKALAERVQFWLADAERLAAAKPAARTLAEQQLALEQFHDRIQAEIERANLPTQ